MSFYLEGGGGGGSRGPQAPEMQRFLVGALAPEGIFAFLRGVVLRTREFGAS